MSPNHRVQPDVLREFSQQVFSRAGLNERDAADAADVLIWTSLRGVDTHGIRNLKRYYIDGIEEGSIDPRARLETVCETSNTATLDGNAGLGLVVARRAMEIAIEKASTQGVGIVTVRNSHHFGAAGYYAHQAVAHEMLGFCANGYFFHNGQLDAVLPFGGALPMLSTNPLAMAAPAGDLPPFVLDMSTSVVPVNRLELMSELGREIPEGWGRDANGLPTTDPQAVRQLLPLGGAGQLGGHKGFGLALAVQILTGVLSGAWSRNPNPACILGEHTEPKEGFGQSGVAHILAAIRIDAFGEVADFRTAMDGMIRILNDSPTDPGREQVVTPGQLEQRTADERMQTGIPLNAPTVADLNSLSEKYRVPLTFLNAEKIKSFPDMQD
ncbi:MAG: Ldh family oxidoreductase [Planctomycetaceae bacterium]